MKTGHSKGVSDTLRIFLSFLLCTHGSHLEMVIIAFHTCGWDQRASDNPERLSGPVPPNY